MFVTNGSMQADAFLFDALVQPGDTVIVERPTYDRTLLSLRNRGADVRDGGARDRWDRRRRARARDRGGVRPKLAHIIPNFQNPAGYTLSAVKREGLLALAREHEFTIFEDDPYVALRFAGSSPPTMLSMDPDRVVYASSFSKTVCPGIRVGYLVGPERADPEVVKIATSTYISPSMVSQAIVNEFCRSRRDRGVDRDRQGGAAGAGAHTVRGARARASRRAVRQPQGGYFLWVDLPPGTDVAALFTPPPSAGCSSSRARTSSSMAARGASGSPTRVSRPQRSRKACSGSAAAYAEVAGA